MLGSAAIIVMDETTSMVWVAKNLIHFYKHESCGKCTPCREGADWLYKILDKIERGEGQMRDIDLLLSVCNNIGGKTLCPFGDAEIAPVLSTIQHFRHEYETYIREGGPCPWRTSARGRRWARTDAESRWPTFMVPSSTIPVTIAYIAIMLVVFFALQISAAVLVYFERKIAAFAQQRLGPNRVGPWGLLQPLADIVKLIFKEELRPKAADFWLFYLAPMLSATDRLRRVRRRAVRPDDRLLRAAAGADPAAGRRPQRRGAGGLRHHLDGRLRHRARRLGSNSKYSLLGGLRSSAQMLSYELSYGMALASVLVIGNSLSLREIVDAQAGTGARRRCCPIGWFVVPQPVGFLIFMIAGIAETNRAPFDFPEAEQELVAGYHTEYSSMGFALFFLAEYINMVTVSAVATDLFLGGWHYAAAARLGWLAGVVQLAAEGRVSCCSSTSGCGGRCRAIATTS